MAARHLSAVPTPSTARGLVETFLRDQRKYGQHTSAHTQEAYRHVLILHLEDLGLRGPLEADRNDVKRTLDRWDYAPTRARQHAVLTSFYDWACYEDLRANNPARRIRKVRRTAPKGTFFMTREEVTALMAACQTVREVRLIFLGVLTGGRRAELAGLQGRHFDRPQVVWYSSDITKGHRERFVPVFDELKPVIAEIRSSVGRDRYVLTARRQPDGRTPLDHTTITKLLRGVVARAALSERITPHTMRQAFGDHVCKWTDAFVAQQLLGHADIRTTVAHYVSRPGLDELAERTAGFRYTAGPFLLPTPCTKADAAATRAVG